MNVTGKQVMLTIIVCSFFLSSNAQVLPDSIIKKIDRVFTGKNAAPGFTIGIVRNDSLIFSKGYGLANMEYNIPNSPSSIYHMASVSKQFTAYCILLLEKQGKLNLENDVRKYLTWFPDLKHKITIRHLLNHTSGIRDHWDLNIISGRRMDDVITQDYLLTLLSRQKALNYIPGEEYSYSNSNYTMMAEIVKSISGKSLRMFADSAIFKPLGMTSTHFHDDHTEIVPDRAYSYRPLDSNRFANTPLNYANAGATSLFTNIPDMSKWVMNFYDPKIGGASVLEKLTTKGILNSGKQIPYASGIVVDDYNGKRCWSHNGADAGYRTNVSVFPGEKIGFIIFSNLSTANIVAKSNELTDIFINPLPPVQKKKIDSALAKWQDTLAIAPFTGNYISEDGVQFSFKLKDQQLFWTSPGATYLLARMQNDTLVPVNNPDVRFIFSRIQTGQLIVDQYWPENKRRLKKYPSPPTDSAALQKELLQYVGEYYSTEADNTFIFAINKKTLEFSTRQSLTIKNSLEYIHSDLFRRGNNLFRFKRNNKNEVVAFELSTGRTRHLLFEKVKP